MSKSIPKIIHYCWFGGNDKPEYLTKYMHSWQSKLPNYKIIEWNEDNFDIDFCNYTREAYSLKKYAFVSDVARLFALYNYGGIYLDTDVEVLKSFDDILENKSLILGFEVENRIATSFIASVQYNNFILEFMNIYTKMDFVLENQTLNLTPNVEYLTKLLKDFGLEENGEFQKLNDDIYIYPIDYFSPYDYINCIDNSSHKSYCVHYFAVSWLNKSVLLKRKFKTVLVKIIGKKGMLKLREFKNDFIINIKKKG